MAAYTPFSAQHVYSVYRRALRLTLSWSIRRDIWRQQALQIRARFDANKDVSDPRKIRVRFCFFGICFIMCTDNFSFFVCLGVDCWR